MLTSSSSSSSAHDARVAAKARDVAYKLKQEKLLDDELKTMREEREQMSRTAERIASDLEALEDSYLRNVLSAKLELPADQMGKLVTGLSDTSAKVYEGLANVVEKFEEVKQRQQQQQQEEEEADKLLASVGEQATEAVDGSSANEAFSDPSLVSAPFKQKLSVAGDRLRQIFTAGRKSYDDVLRSMTSTLEENASEGDPTSDAPVADAAEIVIPMLTRKVETLGRALELSILRAETYNVQLMAEKARSADLLATERAASVKLARRLAIQDAKNRLNEQVQRDPNMLSNVVTRAEFDEVNRERQDLQSQLKDKTTECSSLASALAQVTDDMKKAQRECEAAVHAQEVLQSATDSLKRNAEMAEARLTKDLGDAEAHMKNLQEAAKEASSRAREHDKEVASLKAAHAEALQQAEADAAVAQQDLQAQVADLQRAVKRKVLEYDSLQNKLSIIEEKLRDKASELEERGGEMRSLTNKLLQLDASFAVATRAQDLKFGIQTKRFVVLGNALDAVRTELQRQKGKTESPEASIERQAAETTRAAAARQAAQEAREQATALALLEQADKLRQRQRVAETQTLVATADSEVQSERCEVSLDIDVLQSRDLSLMLREEGESGASPSSSQEEGLQYLSTLNSQLVALVQQSAAAAHATLSGALSMDADESSEGRTQLSLGISEILRSAGRQISRSAALAAELAKASANAAAAKDAAKEAADREIAAKAAAEEAVVMAAAAKAAAAAVAAIAAAETERAEAERKEAKEDMDDSMGEFEDGFGGLTVRTESIAEIESLKKELREGDLSNIGTVSRENFERLKGKDLGSDDVVTLTSKEHLLRYEDDGFDGVLAGNSSLNEKANANGVGLNVGSEPASMGSTSLQTQMMQLERNNLEARCLSQHTIKDLARFKQNTEHQILKLATMNALKKVAYYRDGGQFMDVLMVHRDVLDMLITRAGSWRAAMDAVRREAISAEDASKSGPESALTILQQADTSFWPEFFRIQVLELYRTRLASLCLKTAEQLRDELAIRESIKSSAEEEKAILRKQIDNLMGENESLKAAKCAPLRKVASVALPTTPSGPPQGSSSSLPLDDELDTVDVEPPALTAPAPDAVEIVEGAVEGSVVVNQQKEIDRQVKAALEIAAQLPAPENFSPPSPANDNKPVEDPEVLGKINELLSTLHPQLDVLAREMLVHDSTALCISETLLDAIDAWKKGYINDAADSLQQCLHVDPLLPLEYVKNMLQLLEIPSCATAPAVITECGYKLESTLSILEEQKQTQISTFFQTQAQIKELQKHVKSLEDMREREHDERHAESLANAEALALVNAQLLSLQTTIQEQNDAASQHEARLNRVKLECKNQIDELGHRVEVAVAGEDRAKQESEQLQRACQDLEARLEKLQSKQGKSANVPVPSADESSPSAAPAPAPVVAAMTVTTATQTVPIVAPPRMDMGINTDPISLGLTISADAGNGPSADDADAVSPLPKKAFTRQKTVSDLSRELASARESRKLQENQQEAIEASRVEQFEMAVRERVATVVKAMVKPQVECGTQTLRQSFNDTVGSFKSIANAMNQDDTNDDLSVVSVDSFTTNAGNGILAPIPFRPADSTNNSVDDSHFGLEEISHHEQSLDAPRDHHALPVDLYKSMWSVALPPPLPFPPGFALVHVRDAQLELCPGVLLASRTLLKPYELALVPKNVMYCYREPDAAYSENLRRLPRYIAAPKIPTCEAVQVPPIFSISAGVTLLLNFVPPPNVTLHPDVYLIQIEKGANVPPGMTLVELQPQVTVPPEIRAKIPAGLELVQTNFAITLPPGVVISRGVETATVPKDLQGLLPFNTCLIRRRRNEALPPFVLPLVTQAEEASDVSAHAKMSVSVCVVKRPAGVVFMPGMEIIRRPFGHPLPPGMSLCPVSEHPEGLVLGPGYELVQLTPLFDLPDGAIVADGWSAYPRPDGVTLAPGSILLKYSGEHGGAGLLPPYLKAAPNPDLPHGTVLPSNVLAAVFLPGLGQSLPVGTVLADGIVVLSVREYAENAVAHGWPCNAVLVERQPWAVMPPCLERGSRSDLPSGVRLPANCEVHLLTVRFVLPAGVLLDPGVLLGPGVQLSPGTVLNRDLEVLERPYGVTLSPGTELVSILPQCDLPHGYHALAMQPPLGLNPHHASRCKGVVVKLPVILHLLSGQQLAERVEVVDVTQACARLRHEQETSGVALSSFEHFYPAEISAAIPPGHVLITRFKRNQLPAGMASVPKSVVPPLLARFLKRRKIAVRSSVRNALTEARGGKEKVIELVSLPGRMRLPEGTSIAPGLETLPVPAELEGGLPGCHWAELVSLAALHQHTSWMSRRVHLAHPLPPNTALVAVPTWYGISLPPQAGHSSASAKGNAAKPGNASTNDLTALNKWVHLPLIQSWNSPGLESIVTPESLCLPLGHFMIQRQRRHGLPIGIVEGSDANYGTISLSLPPGVEIVHLLSSFSLPVSIALETTNPLVLPVLTLDTIRAGGRDSPGSAPSAVGSGSAARRIVSAIQLAAGQKIGPGLSVLPYPQEFLRSMLPSAASAAPSPVLGQAAGQGTSGASLREEGDGIRAFVLAEPGYVLPDGCEVLHDSDMIVAACYPTLHQPGGEESSTSIQLITKKPSVPYKTRGKVLSSNFSTNTAFTDTLSSDDNLLDDDLGDDLSLGGSSVGDYSGIPSERSRVLFVSLTSLLPPRERLKDSRTVTDSEAAVLNGTSQGANTKTDSKVSGGEPEEELLDTQDFNSDEENENGEDARRSGKGLLKRHAHHDKILIHAAITVPARPPTPPPTPKPATPQPPAPAPGPDAVAGNAGEKESQPGPVLDQLLSSITAFHRDFSIMGSTGGSISGGSGSILFSPDASLYPSLTPMLRAAIEAVVQVSNGSKATPFAPGSAAPATSSFFGAVANSGLNAAKPLPLSDRSPSPTLGSSDPTASELLNCLDMAQDEIHSLELDNNKYRKECKTLRQQVRRLDKKCERLTERVTDFTTVSGDKIQKLAELEGKVAFAEAQSKIKGEEVAKAKREAVESKARWETQVDVLAKQLAVWMDANDEAVREKARFIAIYRAKERMHFLLLAKFVGQIQRQCEAAVGASLRGICDAVFNIFRAVQAAEGVSADSAAALQAFLEMARTSTFPNLSANTPANLRGGEAGLNDGQSIASSIATDPALHRSIAPGTGTNPNTSRSHHTNPSSHNSPTFGQFITDSSTGALLDLPLGQSDEEERIFPRKLDLATMTDTVSGLSTAFADPSPSLASNNNGDEGGLDAEGGNDDVSVLSDLSPRTVRADDSSRQKIRRSGAGSKSGSNSRDAKAPNVGAPPVKPHSPRLAMLSPLGISYASILQDADNASMTDSHVGSHVGSHADTRTYQSGSLYGSVSGSISSVTGGKGRRGVPLSIHVWPAPPEVLSNLAQAKANQQREMSQQFQSFHSGSHASGVPSQGEPYLSPDLLEALLPTIRFDPEMQYEVLASKIGSSLQAAFSDSFLRVFRVPLSEEEKDLMQDVLPPSTRQEGAMTDNIAEAGQQSMLSTLLQALQGVLDGGEHIEGLNDGDDESSRLAATEKQVSQALLDWSSSVSMVAGAYTFAEGRRYLNALDFAETEVRTLLIQRQRLEKKASDLELLLIKHQQKWVPPTAPVAGISSSSIDGGVEELSLRNRILDLEDSVQRLRSQAPFASMKDFLSHSAARIKSLRSMEQSLHLWAIAKARLASEEERKIVVGHGTAKPIPESERVAIAHRVRVLRKDARDYQARAALLKKEQSSATLAVLDDLQEYQKITAQLLPKRVILEMLQWALSGDISGSGGNSNNTNSSSSDASLSASLSGPATSWDDVSVSSIGSLGAVSQTSLLSLRHPLSPPKISRTHSLSEGASALGPLMGPGSLSAKMSFPQRASLASSGSSVVSVGSGLQLGSVGSMPAAADLSRFVAKRGGKRTSV